MKKSEKKKSQLRRVKNRLNKIVSQLNYLKALRYLRDHKGYNLFFLDEKIEKAENKKLILEEYLNRLQKP